MNSKTYIDQILSKCVKEWISRGDDFILQEDRDSAYTSKETETYKKQLGLEYYYTPGASPDLIAIETIALMFKTKYRAQQRHTKEEYIDAAKYAYSLITQEKINHVIKKMHTRYQKCIELDRQMTAF